MSWTCDQPNSEPPVLDPPSPSTLTFPYIECGPNSKQINMSGNIMICILLNNTSVKDAVLERIVCESWSELDRVLSEAPIFSILTNKVHNNYFTKALINLLHSFVNLKSISQTWVWCVKLLTKIRPRHSRRNCSFILLPDGTRLYASLKGLVHHASAHIHCPDPTDMKLITLSKSHYGAY